MMAVPMLIDSHCHLDRLDLTAYDGCLDSALQAARERGVVHFLCIGISVDNAPVMRELAGRYADVDCSVGVHPLDLSRGSEPTMRWLLDELDHPGVVAVGETGLDYHYQSETAQMQQDSFRLHLDAARQCGKPVIVHTREAKQDTLDLLREAALPQYYISFSGIVTFRNAAALREVALQVPSDRILVETDSPYLAPIPHRGRANFPEYVVDVAQFVAELRGVPYEEFAAQTTDNFKRLFPLARVKAS